MKSVFDSEEIALILDLLDNMNDDPSLSFLYTYIGHNNYAYWYDSVYDKLESYSPLTPFTIQEIDVIIDALRPIIVNAEMDSHTQSIVYSADKKARIIREALLPSSK